MILTMQNPAPTKPQAPMVSGGRDVVVVDVDGEGGEEMAVEMPLHLRKLRLNDRWECVSSTPRVSV